MIDICPDQLDLRLSCFRPVHAKAQSKMTASLVKYGQLTPVTAVENKGAFILIDGFKRHRSAKQLNIGTLRVVPLKKSDSEAKALIYLLNRQTGFSMICEAMLIRDLIEVEGLNQVEVANILERHKSWVCRRLQMIRSLSSQIIDDIKLNIIPAGAGPSLARLPCDNQADFSLAIQQHGLKYTEVNTLVNLWCQAKDPGVRQYLLKSPRQSLQIVKPNKEKWLLLIEAVLSKMSKLNRQLETMKISRQEHQVLTDLMKLIQAHIAKFYELTAKGAGHESVK